MKIKKQFITRRDFLKLSSLGLGYLSTGGLGLSQAHATSGPAGFKALVLFEFLGGIEPCLLSTPTDPTLYNALLSVRGSQIINTDTNLESIGIPIAWHPNLAPLLPYTDHMRITLNTGTALHVGPNGSHENMQQRLALGGSVSATIQKGWAARTYETVPELTLSGFRGSRGENYSCDGGKCDSNPPSVFKNYEAFKLDGENLHSTQGGAQNTQYVANVLERLSRVSPSRNISPMEEKYRNAFSALFPVIQDVSQTLSYQTPNHDNYRGVDSSYDSLAQRFRNVAMSLNRMKQEGATHPAIFVIGMGGFDVHSNWSNACDGLSEKIGGILRTFLDDLVAMDLFNNVTVASVSEFGRQFKSNGAGTDHGWGYPMLVAGGQINGGSNLLYGSMPTAQDIETQYAWPRVYDSRAIICDILDWMGIDPYTTAFPGEVGSQFARHPFNLFNVVA